jgi:ATP-dependent DNA helicase RecG
LDSVSVSNSPRNCSHNCALSISGVGLPLSGHFIEGRIEREDRLPVPPDALREVLLNAVMHRDYAQPGGNVAIAVFDDRIEISSIGDLPAGIRAEMLSGPHPSVLRNPLIAETFHRTGAVEAWGRGTNRVIEECERWGVAPPSFAEQGGALVVAFPAVVGPAPQVTPQVAPQVTPQVVAILTAARHPRSRSELQESAGLKDREHFRMAYLEPLLATRWLEMTIPDKPTSSKQRYRVTEAGRQALTRHTDGDD